MRDYCEAATTTSMSLATEIARKFCLAGFSAETAPARIGCATASVASVCQFFESMSEHRPPTAFLTNGSTSSSPGALDVSRSVVGNAEF